MNDKMTLTQALEVVLFVIIQCAPIVMAVYWFGWQGGVVIFFALYAARINELFRGRNG